MEIKELFEKVRHELLESDPDVVVDTLRISSEELVYEFPHKILEYIDNEFAELEDEELEDDYTTE